MSRKKIVILSALLVIIMLPALASAINLNDAGNLAGNLGLNTKDQTFGDIFLTILNFLLALAFIIALIYIVISGYTMITARGNEEQVESAKKGLTWAIIGIVVIFLAWIILTIVVAVANTGTPGG